MKKFFARIKNAFGGQGKSGNFLSGAIILAAAGITCRILGVVFRIPLTNIVGNFGMGLYQMVFPLYSLLLVISSAGFPIAISRMVAKEKIDGNLSQCRKILLNALVLLGAIGLVISALFMIFAHNIAQLQGNGDVGIIYLAIAPSVLIVCLIAAFRGYFQGLHNMVPTAASQIIEQLVKVAAGITLAVIFIKKSVEWAVFGAILAVTISEVAAFIFLILIYLWSLKKKNTPSRLHSATTPHTREGELKAKIRKGLDLKLMWQVLKQSSPVTLVASIFPLILVFDSMVVINMLKAAGNDGTTATQLFGISSGAVHTLINLPAVLGAAVATAIVPTVTALLKQNKTEEMREKCALAIKLTFLISLFFVLFYLVFAAPTIDLLYHGAFKTEPEQFKTAVNLMRIESSMILFMSLTAVFTAMMQGIGKARYPLIGLAAGGAVKIAFELALIKTKLGIYAVSIGNVLCFSIAMIINTIFVLRHISMKPKLATASLKTAALAGIFGASIYALGLLIPKNRYWLFLSGSIALAAYVLLVWVLKFHVFGNKSKQGDKK